MKLFWNKFIYWLSSLFKATATHSNPSYNPLSQQVDNILDFREVQDLINEYPTEPPIIYSSNLGQRVYFDGDLVMSSKESLEEVPYTQYTPEKEEWLEYTPI